MFQTTTLFSRRILLTSVSVGQDVRKLGTAVQEAHKRRSLVGRVALVTASTDGYSSIRLQLIQNLYKSHKYI